MKNLFKVALLATGLFAASQTFAETAHVDSLGHKIGHAAKKVGHKTSEIAANGASTVVDKRFRDKRGPHGEVVYINKHSHYYYINKKGHRVYVAKSALKNEVED